MADTKLTALTLGTPYPSFVYGTDAGANPRKFVVPVAWFNVRAYGAVGDGSNNDTSAIQAAVNAMIAAGGGTVYFPPTSVAYNVTSSITFNSSAELNFVFRGEGYASRVNGAVVGDYVFKRDGPDLGKGIKVFEKMYVSNNDPTGGALRMRYCIGFAIRDCVFAANQGVDTASCQSGTIQGCAFITNGQNVGSMGVVISEDTHILNCDITGCDVGVAASQSACNITGCRFEVNGTAIKMGFDPWTGSNFAAAFTIQGNMFESNGTCIDLFGGCGFGLVAAMSSQAFGSTTPYERAVVTSTTISFSPSGASGTGSITTAGILTISGVTGTIVPTADRISGTGVPNKTQVYSQLTGTAGKDGTYALTGAAAYGLRVRNSAHDITFTGVGMGGNPYVACISILNNDAFAHNTFINCVGNNSGGLGGANWVLPTTAKSALFINCKDGTNGLNAEFTVVGLPTLADGAYTGMEVNVSDSNTATWGATIASGGSNHVLGRFNGTTSLWTVVGK